VLDFDDIETIVQRALDEDLPDITSDAIFGAEERGRATFLVKGDGVLAGLRLARAVFATLDASTRFTDLKKDGDTVAPGEIVATVEASVRALLSGERTALNLMQRASGIATSTRRYVERVAGTKAKVVDTRKTAPGLRALDKFAVTCGGGQNHRIGLYDMFLVKNNHIDRAGSITRAVELVRAATGKQPLMVEVRNLEELDEVLPLSPDYILLDNMSLEQLEESVRRTEGKVPLEASGGVTLETIAAVARTGVDRISVGALTHSVQALDISFRIEPLAMASGL